MASPQIPPQPFESCKEYADFLHDNLPAVEFPVAKDIWLGQINKDGPLLQWYRYTGAADRSSDPDSVGFTLRGTGTGVSAYQSTKRVSTFRDQLLKTDISQQILIVVYDETLGHDWDDAQKERLSQRYDWASDVFGLALDIPLEVWDYLSVRLEAALYSERIEPIPLIADCRIIDVGDHSLLLLEQLSGTQPITAIMFLTPKFIVTRMPVSNNWRTVEPRPGPRFYPPPLPKHRTPSQTWSKDLLKVLSLAEREHSDSWYIRRQVSDNCLRADSLAHNEFLYLCLQFLIKLQLSKPSCNIPFFRFLDGNNLTLKYYQAQVVTVNDGSADMQPISVDMKPISVNMHNLWVDLRNEVDALRIQRRTLGTLIPRDDSQLQNLKVKGFIDLFERLDVQIYNLELTENTLRDRIAVRAAKESAELAAQSIKESKRGIMLTTLAFVFLPLSLASSIYGMNLQQINNSGHSITAFVITAVALSAGAMVMWVATNKFISLRSQVKDHQCSGEKPSSTLEEIWVSTYELTWLTWYCGRFYVYRARRGIKRWFTFRKSEGNAPLV